MTPQPEQIEASVPVDFGQAGPTITPCTYNECAAGHRWNPQIQIAACPGCRTPMLAVKMLQCPICNEPVLRMVMRSEHLPQGGQITPLCLGASTLNEVNVVTIERTHASQEQQNHVVRDMIGKV